MKKEEVPSLQLFYRLKVHDKDGKLVKDIGQLPAKSLVIQFLEGLFAQMEPNITSISITDTGNIERAVTEDTDNFKANAPAGTSTYGIVVGTGTIAPSNTDYKLGAQIAHGTGTGQLSYGAMSILDPAIDTNVDLVMSRVFTNSSGASITVNKIGLYCCFISASYFFCIIRDTPPPVEVQNNQSLTVEYTLRTTA